MFAMIHRTGYAFCHLFHAAVPTEFLSHLGVEIASWRGRTFFTETDDTDNGAHAELLLKECLQ